VLRSMVQDPYRTPPPPQHSTFNEGGGGPSWWFLRVGPPLLWCFLINSDPPTQNLLPPPPPPSRPLTASTYRPRFLPTPVLHSLISLPITSPLSCVAYHHLPCVSHSCLMSHLLSTSPTRFMTHVSHVASTCVVVVPIVPTTAASLLPPRHLLCHITSAPLHLSANVLSSTFSQSSFCRCVFPHDRPSPS
jgi:hypothetical protein